MSRSVEELLDAPAGAMDALWPLVAAAPAQDGKAFKQSHVGPCSAQQLFPIPVT